MNKKPRLTECNAAKRNARYTELHDKFGHIVLQLLEEGAILKDIMRIMQMGAIPTVNYLKWAGLNEQRLLNSKRYIQNIARANGTKSKDTLGGKELKPLTDEVKQWYLAQLDAGRYRWQIRSDLEATFGLKEKKYYQLVKLFGAGKKNPQTGHLNAMYGVSPVDRAGRGIHGHICIHGAYVLFRSLLELRIFLGLVHRNIPFVLSNHRISYTLNGNARTYVPDIVVGDVVYEIKPSKLVNRLENIIKWTAAKEYFDSVHLKFEVITEHSEWCSALNKDELDLLRQQSVVHMNDIQYNRALKYVDSNRSS